MEKLLMQNKVISSSQKKKNVMLSGNIARSLGAARSIGRATSLRSPIPKVSNGNKVNRHKEHR
jgi:hypothetical protein